MSTSREFDIYQTETGYVAVTNPTRRQILASLAEQDRDLPGLVKITKKSKPTLSNLHVRELLEAGLVEERAHATDARRKLFRLKARRIGSSNVPIDQLPGGVRQYVAASPFAYSIPFATIMDVLLATNGASARPEARAALREATRAQASTLGAAAAHLFLASDPRDLLTGVSSFWEREGVARVQKIDYDRLEVEVELEARWASTRVALEGAAVVLAGFLDGVVGVRLGKRSTATGRPGPERRATIGLPVR
ncbi:MAG TPA: transcriptional regulator [Candidatus Thermoplasmatota archaeon]|nr:transcriptional regulator [Candidatus Thermoplasmatota archaeon]